MKKSIIALSLALAATSAGAVTIENAATAPYNEKHKVQIGHNASATGATAIAIGTSVTSTGNGAFTIGSDSTTIGQGSVTYGIQAQNTGNLNVLIGHKAVAADSMVTAIGSNSQGLGESSVAIGKGTITYAGATGSTAVGPHAEAFSGGATALGLKANAIGGSSTALGKQAVSNGRESLAAGAYSQADGAFSTAIGTGAVATQSHSVALGTGSATKDRTRQTSATIDGIKYGTFAGNNPNSVVSVGSAGAERQIVNVGAGEVSATSTDAINGSQLYAVAKQTSANANAIAGLDARVDSNAKQIATNAANIAANANAIAAQDLRIENNSQQIAINAKSIANVDARVTSLKEEYILPMKEQVNTNTLNIVRNEENIGRLANTVSAHEHAIIGLNADVSHLQSVAETHDFQIGELNVITNDNSQQITKNAAGIATNAQSIVQLNKDVKAAKTEVEAGKNIKVDYTTGSNGQLIYTVSTADKVEFAEVKAGGATLGANGVDMGGQRVQGVAAGVDSTDAVNVAQLNEVQDQVNANAQTINSNTNRLGELEKLGRELASQIQDTDKDARAGVASAIAHAALPQPYQPGQGMFSVAGGHYRGHNAGALGVSYITPKGRFVTKASASFDDRNKWGVGLGLGIVLGKVKPATQEVKVVERVVQEVIVREVQPAPAVEKKIRG